LGLPVFILVAAALAGQLTATVPPCTSATPACAEWIKLPGQTTRLLVYRTKALAVKDERVTRALVLVHGILRDADNHFRTAVAAGFLAGALDDTVIIAPRFASDSRARGNEVGNCGDSLASKEANWFCDSQRSDTWRSGGTTVDGGEFSSFRLHGRDS